MKTRNHTLLSLAAIAGLTLTATTSEAADIYRDSFTRSGDLDGSAPETRPGAETWSSTNWETTGTVSSASSNDAAGYLPFVPSAGTVYTLSATIDVTVTTHARHFYGIGFTTGTPTTPFEANVPAYFYEGQSNGWDAFAESNNGNASGIIAQGTAPAGVVEYAIELDTTAPAWTAKFFVNGGEVASHTYVTNPTINYVALGNWHAESGGTDGTLDSFTLSDDAGSAVPFVITEIEYDADAEPDPTVTLTWRKSGAESYIAKVSTDLGDWMTDIGDSLTANLDENPEDADHITMTLPLPPGPDYVGEAFFRIEEE